MQTLTFTSSVAFFLYGQMTLSRYFKFLSTRNAAR